MAARVREGESERREQIQMKIGYIAVILDSPDSSPRPTTSILAEHFTRYPVSRFFFDVVAKSEVRRELERALEEIGPGDTLVVPTISSLGDSIAEVRANLGRIAAKSAFLHSIRERFDTASSLCLEPGDLIEQLADLAGAASQKSGHPTRSASAGTKNKGGRRYALSPGKVGQAMQWLSEGIPPKEVARRCGCSPRTIGRVGRGTYGVPPAN